MYDGIPTHTLNLDALRSNITIIPQVVRALISTIPRPEQSLTHDESSPNCSAARSVITWTFSPNSTTRH